MRVTLIPALQVEVEEKMEFWRKQKPEEERKNGKYKEAEDL